MRRGGVVRAVGGDRVVPRRVESAMFAGVLASIEWTWIKAGVIRTIATVAIVLLGVFLAACSASRNQAR